MKSRTSVRTKIRPGVNGTTGGGTTNTAPTVANEILDQAAAVGTALNYEFPANTFADTDAATR